MKSIKVLWLIVARAGSRSVPNKNIKLLGRYPLLAYRIKLALSISEASNVWLSTDNDEYAAIGRQFGANIPFIRPSELATDTARSADVVLHAMDFAEKNGYQYEYIGLLEPTSPFIYHDDILKALNVLNDDQQADSIVAVKRVRTNSFFVQDQDVYLSELAVRLEQVRQNNRQHFKDQVTPSGGFYISKWNSFKSKATFYTRHTIPYSVPVECELEIDEPIDWTWAEFLLERKIINISKIFPGNE